MKANAPTKTITPVGVLRAFRRRWLWLILPSVLLMPGVWYLGQKMPPRYRAHALVGPTPGAPVLFDRNQTTAAASAQDQLREVRATLLNQPVLESVIREFHLDQGTAPAQAVNDLKSRIQIQVDSPETFYVGVEGSDPDQVVRLANRLAEVFVERTTETRGKRLEHADRFLDSEVERLRQEVDRQEYGLKAYKEKAAQVLPDRLAANLKQIENLQQQIQTRTDQITEGEARRTTITAEMQSLERQGVLEPEPHTKSAAELAVEQARRKLDELRTKYTEEHPEVKRAKSELQDLESRRPEPVVERHAPSPVQVRYFGLQAELKSIDPKLKSYREERQALSTQLTEFEQKINETPGYETGISERMRDAAVLRARYEAMYAKQQELNLSHRAEQSEEAGVSRHRVLEEAQAPPSLVGLTPQRLLLLGLVASLGLGLLGVFMRERFDTSFQTSEEFERFTDVPVLTCIPTIPKPRLRVRSAPKNAKGLSLVEGGMERNPVESRRHFQRNRVAVLSDPESIAAQQYGILAMKVQSWLERNDKKVLAVTSAAGEEGKSVTACNLALALAACSPGRVLLVDCDLRLSRVAERLGLDGGKGLSEVLADEEPDTERYISRVGALDVIAGGSSPTDPVTLLASRRMKSLMNRLRQEYQLIVLDTPPIVPIADTHILAGLADGIVMVVRARQTKSELFRRAVENLGSSNLMGVVLNDVEYTDTPYAYAYKYQKKRVG